MVTPHLVRRVSCWRKVRLRMRTKLQVLRSNFLTVLFIMTPIVVIVLLAGRNHIFINEAKALRAVAPLSLRDVVIHDRDDVFVSWNGCADDDAVSYEMSGKNQLDESVDLVVCCASAFGKGCTARTK